MQGFVYIFVGAVLAGAVAAAGAAAAPLDAYTHLPSLEQPKLSPLGDRLAYIAVVGDSRRLGVQTLTGQSLGTVPLGNQKVRAVEWADEDHVLVTVEKYLEVKEAQEKQNLDSMVIYNLKTKTFAKVLNQRGTGSQRANTETPDNVTAGPIVLGRPTLRRVDGKTLMYVYGLDVDYHQHRYRIDLETGDGVREHLAEGVLDENGKPLLRETAHKDSGHWELQYRDGLDWKTMMSAEGFKNDWPSLFGVGRTPGTATISLPEDGGNALYEVDRSGKRTKLRFSPKDDIGDAIPIYRQTTGELIGFYYEIGDSQDVAFLDPKVDDAWLGVRSAFKDQHLSLASMTPDQSKFIVHVASNTDSGSFYLIDNATHHSLKIGSDYPTVASADVAEVRYISYKAADGTNIPAYLTLPKGKDPKNLPLIILPHGGPQARDEPGFDWFSQSIASRGYAVLQPEFRGSDGFGKAHLEAGYGQWGRKMQTDLSDGVRYLASQGIADPKRVCIFGWSYGGYAALAGPTLDPGIYKCAVAGAPVSDLNDMIGWEKERSGGAHDSLIMRYFKRYMGASSVGDPRLAEISPARHADRVTVPILLVHGQDDTTVPYRQSILMQRALLGAGKPVELVTLDGEDHYLTTSAMRKKAFDAIVAFLEKYNPPT